MEKGDFDKGIEAQAPCSARSASQLGEKGIPRRCHVPSLS
jgi:hypothetical protein